VRSYENDGLCLRYEVLGQGPPVLCVHGATGTGRYEWSDLAAALGDRHRFVVPDLRGHGQSDHQAGNMGIEYVNDDLRQLIEQEKLGQPHLMAFSFGAEAALELEVTRPATSASLVLISPGLGDPKSSVPTREQLEAGWPRSLRRLHAERHGNNHWLDLMMELCERATARPKADAQTLAAIGCPVLLIVGSKDDPRRIRQARVFQAANDKCRMVIVEGARHAVHKERPAEVAAVVGDFLERATEIGKKQAMTPANDSPRSSPSH
jgi:pimeloyl-ACP methyl ester carboxylesterase